MARRVVATALTTVVAVAAGVLVLQDGDAHRIKVVVPSAQGLIAGLDVRAAGRPVGSVEEVEVRDDRRARVVLRIDDDRVLPLPADTRLQLRLGGTIKYTDRYIDLQRGRAAGAGIPDGGTIASGNFVAPTEFDQLVGTFDARTRKDLRRMISDAGAAIGPAGDDLQDALAEAPPALDQAAAVIDDLGYDTRPLEQLVASGDRVVDALDRADPGVGDLVQHASTTFDAVAGEAASLQRALRAMPAALGAARATLRRADHSLTATSRVLDELAPGVTETRRLVAPLESALGAITDVGPDARRTLTSVRAAAPDLTRLLGRLTPLAPVVESVAREADRQLDCLRPYTPELAGLLGSWVRTWGMGDGTGKYLRAHVGSYTMGNVNTQSTADVVRRSPGLRVAFPQPPGFVAGQPWFLPRCGITEDVFDPAKDPESQAAELYPEEFKRRRYPDPETGK